MNLCRKRGFRIISEMVGIPDPALAWDVLVYRFECDRKKAIRDAVTLFRLEVARQKGGEFEDVVSHLRSPSEIARLEKARQEAEEERIIAYFKQLSERNTGVKLSQNLS